MIVVKVELHSAITGKVLEIARMVIANNGLVADPKRGDYLCYTLRGRSSKSLAQSMWRSQLDGGGRTREGAVRNYPRLAIHVWNLVAAALSSMNYGTDLKAKRGGE